MKYVYFILLTLTIVSCKNRISGSGNIIKETRPVSEFNSISATGSIIVDIKNGSIPSLTIEADDNILPYIITDVSAKTLSIKLKGINNLRNATINIHIVLPIVTNLKTSASAQIRSSDIITNAEKILMAASSGSIISIKVDAPAIVAEASSGADIIVSGRTKNLTAKASSASKVNLFELHSESASASASSGGEIKVFASVGIIASASSGANVIYKGGATAVEKKVSSGGSVNPE